MARTPLRVVRDAAARIANYVGPSGEPVFNADTRRLHMQDGVTAGGHPLALLSDFSTTALATPGNPVGDEIGKRLRTADAPPMIDERIDRARMFRRKFKLWLPFCPGVVQDYIKANYLVTGTEAARGPQAMGVDTYANEVYVGHGALKPQFPGALFIVYNLTTGALKRFFWTTQDFRETLIIKYLNADGTLAQDPGASGVKKYLYGLGDAYPYRCDITTNIPNGDVVSLDNTVVYSSAPGSYYEMADVGDGFCYCLAENTENPGGSTAKHRYVLVDLNFNVRRYIEFPIGVTGTQNDYITYFPKCQSTVWHPKLGMYLFQTGAAYYTISGNPINNDPTLVGKRFGLTTAWEGGDAGPSGLTDAATALAVTSAMVRAQGIGTGREFYVHEAEGLSYGADGKLYGLIKLITGGETTTYGRDGGLVLTIEMSQDDDAFDYSKPVPGVANSVGAVPYSPFDHRYSSHIKVYSQAQIKNPITGEPLNDFIDIVKFMTCAAVKEYAFYGAGQTLTCAGTPVATSGVTFFCRNVGSAHIDITAIGGNAYRYWRIGNIRGFDAAAIAAMTISQSNHVRGTDGTVYLGGAEGIDPVGATATLEGMSLNPNGAMRAARNGATVMALGRGNVGYLLAHAYRNITKGGLWNTGTSTDFILDEANNVRLMTGSGSPEGAVTTGAGSIFIRRDGPAGQKVWFKDSGAGNTGWALL
ncbi:hypothetical protein ASF36_13830 [Methylobacterium sp. Leaf90]|nr:hypothetical protein ASF36_13830 [Methylobacterium sp. Leaf90]